MRPARRPGAARCILAPFFVAGLCVRQNFFLQNVEFSGMKLQNDVYYESTRAIQPHSDTYPYTKSLEKFRYSHFPNQT